MIAATEGGPIEVGTAAEHLLWVRGSETTKTELEGLLYLCHAWMLGLRGKPLVAAPVVMKQIPVIPAGEPAETRTTEHAEIDQGRREIMQMVVKSYRPFKSTELFRHLMDEFPGRTIAEAFHLPWRRSVVTDEEITEKYLEKIKTAEDLLEKEPDWKPPENWRPGM